jgi:catechol 2,3-dioxygenase-like lactoylglutathione lyase family enzyme
MTQHAAFKAVFPIGSTDPEALPVKELGPAIGYYTQVLGFTLVQKTERAARLQRDAVHIGVAVNGHDPEQASCYFAVTDVAALHAELASKGIEPTEVQRDEHDGRPLLVFFAKEPYGACFCFGQSEGQP